MPIDRAPVDVFLSARLGQKAWGKSCSGYLCPLGCFCPLGRILPANVDKRYKLIRKVKVSTASEHDSLHLDVIQDTAIPVANCILTKGYVDKERATRLKAQGLRVQLQRKGQGKPLSDC